MDNKKNIEKLVDETLNSIDHINRATPQPFLLTRVNARLNNTRENLWEKAVRLVGRPAFAIPALAMLILVNASVLVFNRTDTMSTSEQISQAQSDDYSFSGTTIYDIENTEP